jgi:hypothetical protein
MDPVSVFLSRLQNIVERRGNIRTRTATQRAIDRAVVDFTNSILSGRHNANEIAKRLRQAQQPLENLSNRIQEAYEVIDETTTILDQSSDANTNIINAITTAWKKEIMYQYFEQYVYNSIYNVRNHQDVMAEIRAWYNRLITQIQTVCELQRGSEMNNLEDDVQRWNEMYEQSIRRLESFCVAVRKMQRYRQAKNWPFVLDDAEGDILIEMINDSAEPGDQDQYGNWKRDWRNYIIENEELLEQCQEVQNNE